ncbi:MAG: glycosyltransferase 87 family protein [Verrucomicrobiaceae bacterium]|nr:glycosyltransferase 87 family protein [Verrucomicrobiaceae bacterium]
MNRQSVFRIVLWFFGFVLLVFTIVPVLHCLRGHSIKDYRVWYETGQLVLQGAEVYPNRWTKFPFMYPPPCALFLAPLAALGKLGLIIVLTLVNAAAWFCTIIFSARLATGEWRRGHVLLYLIPNLVMGAHVWGNFLLGQPSLLLLALMLGAFISLRRQLNVAAGVLIALAAAIKAFPVIAIVYLVYRRYWRAAAAMAATVAFLLVVLPIPFRGYDLAKQDLERWSSGMLFKYDETGVGQRLGRSNSWKNQSVWGVANRLLRHVEYDHKYEPHTPAYANFVDLEFKTVNQIILAMALALGLAFIAVMPASGRRTQETDAIEFALLLLLILIFTPLSFGYLFAWLIYPLTVVVQRLLMERGSLLLLACGITAVTLLALSIPFRVMAQVYGNALLATLLLFVGLATELWRLKRVGGHGETAVPAG